jgi:ribosomal protein L29
MYFGKCLIAQEEELKNLTKKELEDRVKRIKKESLNSLPALRSPTQKRLD